MEEGTKFEFTRAELIEAFTKWETDARENDWKLDPTEPVAAAAIRDADALIAYLPTPAVDAK